MNYLTMIALCILSTGAAHAGALIQVDIPEPSGLDADNKNGRLFVADDGGEVWVLDEEYSEIAVFDIGGDFEGVEYLPDLDRVVIAAEGDEQLLLINPDTGELEEVFDIPRTFQGKTLLAAGGNGIEALTVAGPRIFVANQSFDYGDKEDGSVLMELTVTPLGELEVVDAHRLPILDVSGSLYAAPSGELLLLSDIENRVYRLNIRAMDRLPTGARIPMGLLKPFWVPGVDQEGICLSEGRLLIAQDSGDLYDAGPIEWVMSPMGQQAIIQQWGY